MCDWYDFASERVEKNADTPSGLLAVRHDHTSVLESLFWRQRCHILDSKQGAAQTTDSSSLAKPLAVLPTKAILCADPQEPRTKMSTSMYFNDRFAAEDTL